MARALASILVLLISLFLVSCTGETINPDSLRGGETRKTLSPALFVGKVARAYAAAREIPEVLDSIHCYCDCKKKHGHKSLLTCYVDRHATDCKACIDEAVMAYKLHTEGKDVVTIRKTIDRLYSR